MQEPKTKADPFCVDDSMSIYLLCADRMVLVDMEIKNVNLAIDGHGGKHSATVNNILIKRLELMLPTVLQKYFD